VVIARLRGQYEVLVGSVVDPAPGGAEFSFVDQAEVSFLRGTDFGRI
jgi:hypothetical protein